MQSINEGTILFPSQTRTARFPASRHEFSLDPTPESRVARRLSSNLHDAIRLTLVCTRPHPLRTEMWVKVQPREPPILVEIFATLRQQHLSRRHLSPSRRHKSPERIDHGDASFHSTFHLARPSPTALSPSTGITKLKAAAILQARSANWTSSASSFFLHLDQTQKTQDFPHPSRDRLSGGTAK